MTFDALDVPGAWSFTPRQHHDERGMFLEAFTADALREATGRTLTLEQANCSVSRAGVLRGIHFSDVPPGQAKYISCVRGAVLDVVVDVRTGSPTFGVADAVRLDDVDRRAVFVSEGLGHGFVALTDDATVMYQCSTGYAPGREHGVHPLSVGVDWGVDPAALVLSAKDLVLSAKDLVLSAKDAAAPTLSEAAEQGILPRYDAVMEWIALQEDKA
ncbi:dTDP-4-dehydrorhamnose 3,5-epimerase family protein [Tomitella fengzijianii]|uniref:dTDP-4-keto-6-deoxy-D-glucose epimerase n=1 Tax=Tomitella fengzijianii TaxID=2597660 RepID=A0A516X0E3_9ACTN|nr:dTDP-4-dehydrorhamnose 3,5-epimerase [Tomitella fengzijianii]QDQ96467.1 dTDP-4-keto-6-deoxy-D-glucose epimerase [Tomitella fengzijianii]